MGLQVALLLIGLVIVAAVSLSAYDKARISRRFKKSRSEQHKIKHLAKEALSTIESTFQIKSRLDINPGPLTHLRKQFLKQDVRIPSHQAKKIDHTFFEDIDRLEQAASLPLDVEMDVLRDFDDEVLGADVAEPGPDQAGGLPDKQIDFIISLPGKGPVKRNKALGIYKQNEYELTKPRRLYGLRYVEGIWSDLDKDVETTQYSDLMLAIQLVDQQGPVSESELNAFSQIGLKLADALDRPSKLLTNFDDALAKAIRLQDFYNKCDVIASVHILPDGEKPFQASRIKEVAEDLGMVFGPMNIFHMKNDRALGCRHMFSLASLFEPGEFDVNNWQTAEIKGLTLFMQIPHVHAPATTFARMAEVAEDLCTHLGGVLLDQEKIPLSSRGLSIIQSQIETMAHDMQNHGIRPGSETALRLFNV